MPAAEKRKLLRAYRWSSYRGYVGLGKEESFVDYGPLLSFMRGRRRGDRRREMRSFVEAGLGLSEKELLELVSESPRASGSEGFLRRVDELYREHREKSRTPEDVSFRETVIDLSPDITLGAVCDELNITREELKTHRKGSMNKAIAAGMLLEYSGLTRRAIARKLGLSSGAASGWQLRKLSEAMSARGQSAGKLRAQVRRIRKRLDETHSGKEDEG